MVYISFYNSPLGKILIASKNNKLIGLWFENQKYYLGNLKEDLKENNDEEILVRTKEWLDRYFKGERPKIFELNLDPDGSEFRKRVWKILCDIPYGTVITYGKISKRIAKDLGKKSMSAQAIGGAVGHNPISIIIPCHRVVGSNGSLTGYAGGIERKIKLLEIENVDTIRFIIPKN